VPISKYFGGHGKEVLASMNKTYGPKKAKSVFYATENKMEGHLNQMKSSGMLKTKKKMKY
jgi:hypothetical protein